MTQPTTDRPRVPSPHTRCPDPLPEETPESWTDRLAREGAATGVRRQCSIGWHDECSSRFDGGDAECRCDCHAGAAPWLSSGELAVVEDIEDAEPAPESFDPLAAVRRVNALADELDDVANGYRHAGPGSHDAGARNAHYAIADRIRAAIAGPAYTDGYER